MSEFHAEAPQATASEGLTQGPYVAARAGDEPMTFRTIGVDSTNEPPRPAMAFLIAKSHRTVRVGLFGHYFVADVKVAVGGRSTEYLDMRPQV